MKIPPVVFSVLVALSALNIAINVVDGHKGEVALATILFVSFLERRLEDR